MLRRLLFLFLMLLVSSTIFLFCGVLWLNATGFCYSQMRYVPDDEILITTLNMDWRKNMERFVQRNPKMSRSAWPYTFIRYVPTWGRVNGRKMHWKPLFRHGPDSETWGKSLRLFGIYEVPVSLRFDTQVGPERYMNWFRYFDQCGNPTGETDSDSIYDQTILQNDKWNGDWSRAYEAADGTVKFRKDDTLKTSIY